MSDSPSLFRRYFRFRLRTLLLLPVAFLPVWWWLTWPERTSRRFVEALSAGDVATVRRMSEPSEEMGQFWLLAEMAKLKFSPPALLPPTGKERMWAVRQFKIPWRVGSREGDLEGLVASKGRVSLHVPAGTGLFRVYQLLNVKAEEVATKLTDAFGQNANYTFVADVRANRVLTRLPRPLDTHAEAWFSALDAEPESPPSSPTIIYRKAMEKVNQELLQPEGAPLPTK